MYHLAIYTYSICLSPLCHVLDYFIIQFPHNWLTSYASVWYFFMIALGWWCLVHSRAHEIFSGFVKSELFDRGCFQGWIFGLSFERQVGRRERRKNWGDVKWASLRDGTVTHNMSRNEQGSTKKSWRNDCWNFAKFDGNYKSTVQEVWWAPSKLTGPPSFILYWWCPQNL